MMYIISILMISFIYGMNIAALHACTWSMLVVQQVIVYLAVITLYSTTCNYRSAINSMT